MVNLICGVGLNDKRYPAWVNGKHLKEYTLWHGLLQRCHYLKTQEKQPTYVGCLVSENFKNYSYFYEWCQSQVGFNQKGFHLDKDLLFKGNKVYSEDACLFLPQGLNLLLTSCAATRGGLPVGVSAHGGKFAVHCSTDKPRHIGYFNTPEEAFAAYKEVKEAFIKTQAEKWKAFIDPRAYQALMAYEVSITD